MPYIRCCLFAPCTATVHRAPDHNRGGVTETSLLARTQGRTLDCPFNFPLPRVSGWLFVCRCQVCSRQWPRVHARWRFNNPLSGGHRPKERRAPTQGLAGVFFFNKVSFQESILDFDGYVSEVVCGSCTLVGRMSVLGAVFLSFHLASLRFSLRPYQVVDWGLEDSIL